MAKPDFDNARKLSFFEARLGYIKHVAEGRIPIDDTTVSFLVVDTDVDSTTTEEALLRKIQLGLEKGLAETEVARDFFKNAWAFLLRVEAGGIRIARKHESEDLLFDQFSYSLSDLATRLCSGEDEGTLFKAKYDGILILVDEVDNASGALRIGSFFKLLLERLQRRGCDKVMFGIAGLPSLRNVLVQSHPSSLRLFEEIVLDRLSDTEVNRIVDMCLRRANEANPSVTTVTDDARTALVYLSEGYPHFVQQFGHSAFAKDSDDQIDGDDVFKGAVDRGGALELIGDRYYRDNYYNRIQTESYRQVLRIMADSLDKWVSKKVIKAKFKGKDGTLTNAIKALRDREIILSKEGEPGVYRLQHRGFAWWIKMYTTERKALQEELTLDVDGPHSTE